ncbi:TonB-dependent receptor [Olivibacter sp. XZL3]|uniref:SusC/RagA family TonB-linked outer membrane protein n=1 Tax=Olivibacter sp. XZL3 TaxID=1735116 RepID=UPI0010648B28|nr:TonB-dependent receptor [Olivibacter sp. XZL3]
MKPKLTLLCFLLLFGQLARGQMKTITGIVVDGGDNSALSGVSVLIKGTTQGTKTGTDGKFQLQTNVANAVLVFKFLGYETKELSVDNQSQISVQLHATENLMEEVVITGYGGAQSRRTVTSAISQVKAEEIANIPASSSDQLLQGRASGVQVSSNSGTPGGGVSVRIRGTSSINASSEPLYIIDGIPMQSNNLSGLSIGGGITNPMADINPADIESMEVLKDASATAIYGARAANGVVLITTKRGANKKAVINIGAYMGGQEITKKPGVVDGPSFEMLMNEVAENAGNPAPYSNPASALNTDWASPILRTGQLRNVDLSISGGGEKVRYMISGNNFLQEGIMKNSDFSRTTTRVNLDFTPIDKLNMGTSILYSHNSRKRLRNDDNISGGLEGTFFYPPNHGIYNEDGSYFKIPTFENPLAAINETTIGMLTNRFLGTVFAEYEFIPNLKLKSNFSFDYSNVAESVYDNSKTNNGSAVGGVAQRLGTNNSNWIQENVLSYRFTAAGHNLNALIGTTFQQSRTDVATSTGQGFPSDAFQEIVAAAVLRSSSTSTSYGIASFFSRVDYNYQSKYLFTMNLRRDGSSRFGSENKWGTFPSVGLGWVLSEESFMQNLGFLSTVKLRGSYGVTGNQSGINDFQSLGLWGGGAYADLAGIAPTQLANPNLKWETTNQLDLGIEFGLFKDRMHIDIDYYNKHTKDLLLAVSIPRTTGFDQLVQNFGEMRNRGVELGINADVLGPSSALKWDLGFNIATNKNRILKLAAPFNVYNRDIYRYEEGGEMFSFYLHPQTGVNPQTGAIEFEDVNGDGEFDVNNDRRIVGSANPDFFGGITNSFKWKGFDLSAFLQYTYGNDQLNWNRFFQEHGGTRSTNFSTSQLDRWQQPGDITMIPRMTADNYASDIRPSRFLEDGSYMRLKNITVGYSLPASFAKKIGMSTARVYVSGQNVFTITNYTGLDPELTGTASNTLTQGIEFYSMPQPRTFMAGVNLNF